MESAVPPHLQCLRTQPRSVAGDSFRRSNRVSLESWAEFHPTHVAIFAAAMRHLTLMGSNAKLRLYHEVTVATAEQQFFEYYNCHPKTGLLRSTLEAQP